MRLVWILVFLTAGCASTCKTSVSIYLEKDFWVENDSGGKPDLKTRVEYKVEQNGPLLWESR